MSNFDHVSDLVAARERIQNLQERLEQAKADNDKWKLAFDVNVRPINNTFELVVTARVGQRGFTNTISAPEVLSFAGDFDTLSKIVAERMLVQLLKEQVETELYDDFTRGCRNIVQLCTRSSL